jgi:hypothetical protein
VALGQAFPLYRRRQPLPGGVRTLDVAAGLALAGNLAAILKPHLRRWVIQPLLPASCRRHSPGRAFFIGSHDTRISRRARWFFACPLPVSS